MNYTQVRSLNSFSEYMSANTFNLLTYIAYKPLLCFITFVSICKKFQILSYNTSFIHVRMTAALNSMKLSLILLRKCYFTITYQVFEQLDKASHAVYNFTFNAESLKELIIIYFTHNY